MATKKTKQELMEEIEAKNAEIQELKEDINRLDRYKAYDKMADETAAMRDCFVNAGFSKTEAFTLILEAIKAAASMIRR